MERLIILVIAVIVYLIYRAVRGSNQVEGAPQATMPRIAYTGKSYSFSEISPDANLPQVQSIRTKIRGVTKRNPDGAERQRIIRQWCHSGDALYLGRQPNNPVDPNAIEVRRMVCDDLPDSPRLGEQLGYLSRDLAQEFAPRMDDDGFVLLAEISNVTGGEDGENLGVNIEIAVYMPAPEATSPPQPKKRKAHRGADAKAPPQT